LGALAASAVVDSGVVGSGVESGVVDAGVVDSEAAVDAASCEPIAGNLLPDPSFEAGGSPWGEAPWQSASVRIDVSGKAGDVFAFGAAVQRLDDEV